MKLCTSSLFVGFLFATSAAIAQTNADSSSISYGAFAFEIRTTVPGNPEAIFDAITGDVTGWWDHTFSEKPARFYLEAKPGGGFWEFFDDEGNGALHATVIYAHRPQLLRFEGPLGLSGYAVQMVVSYQFSPVSPDSTELMVSVRAAGEQGNTWAPIVKNVWHHFIIDRFKPYVEGGFQPLK